METMIVFLLLGIVAMLGWPSLNSSLEHHRLSGAATEVVTALEFAQLTAMTTGRISQVAIRSGNNRIVVNQYETNADLFGGGEELNAADVENGTYELMGNPIKKGTNYRIILANESRFEGVDITTTNFPADDPVQFDTLGTPSKGGTVTLAMGGRQMVVTLDALTGKITVSE